MLKPHLHWMEAAFREAEKAHVAKEVPVGAVIVKDDQIIGRGYNQTETLHDPTAHAEMIAITAATDTLNSQRLTDCSLYVTLEPCAMCAGALVLARISNLVYGCDDPKAGSCGTLRNVVQDHRLNHQVHIERGIMAQDASMLLQSFFSELRLKSQNNRMNVP